MTEPIRPDEVVAKKSSSMPDEVITVFNELIAEKWNGHSSTILQSEAAECIAGVLDITTSQVYDRKLLDVEDIFRAIGWKVIYDKPGYCESYAATFEFKRK